MTVQGNRMCYKGLKLIRLLFGHSSPRPEYRGDALESLTASVRRSVSFLVILLAAAFSSLTSAPGEGSGTNGKQLYDQYCSTCHGLDGKGEGTAAVYISPKPRDFTRGIYKFQSTPVGSLPTDEDLHRTLKSGMPGSAMPAWDRLSDQQRSDLIAYIKTFSERFATEKPTDILSITSEPPATPEMIKNGKAVYALAGCWMCHGKTGVGDGPSSPLLTDDLGRPIPPYNFTRAGAFKGGGTPRDIYRTFSTGIGGTPMPGYGEDALIIGRESVADLTNLEGQYTSEEIEEVRRYAQQWPAEQELAQMTPEQRKALSDERRWSLVYYVLSLSQSGKKQISYTTTDHQVHAVSVVNAASYADPFASQWQQVKETELALISLWQRDTPTDRVTVRAVADGKSISFHLEWEDATKDDGALYNARFGDAAAMQFPLDPASEPFFGMGDMSFAVNIWQWKSWWEKDVGGYAGVNAAFPANAADFYPFDMSGKSTLEYFASRDSARSLSVTWNAGAASGNLLSAQRRTSPVEDLNGRGFGTLTSQPAAEQNVGGTGTWNNGRWNVVITRLLSTHDKNDVTLKKEMTIPVAFAVWDGALGNRNGQKMVTNWYRLTIGSVKMRETR